LKIGQGYRWIHLCGGHDSLSYFNIGQILLFQWVFEYSLRIFFLSTQ
jgi:hypothetical protein